ncbi:extensin-like [Manacus vitellinus]|uniref:extensin-like n=1 Tax=Manacus vitellinus TaxID=328815 RepID=UPI00115D35BD|nr:extensin-like [Manacus vitellinus]
MQTEIRNPRQETYKLPTDTGGHTHTRALHPKKHSSTWRQAETAPARVLLSPQPSVPLPSVPEPSPRFVPSPGSAALPAAAAGFPCPVTATRRWPRLRVPNPPDDTASPCLLVKKLVINFKLLRAPLNPEPHPRRPPNSGPAEPPEVGLYRGGCAAPAGERRAPGGAPAAPSPRGQRRSSSAAARGGGTARSLPARPVPRGPAATWRAASERLRVPPECTPSATERLRAPPERTDPPLGQGRLRAGCAPLTATHAGRAGR